ncbi:MAG: hypothetical protein ACTSRC_18705 [Candidatus Helarchaeota archaeon]
MSNWKERARSQRLEENEADKFCTRLVAKAGRTPEARQAYYNQCVVNWIRLPRALKKKLRIACAIEAQNSEEEQAACMGTWILQPRASLEDYTARMLEGAQHCAEEMLKAKDLVELRQFGEYCFSLLRSPLKSIPQVQVAAPATALKGPTSAHKEEEGNWSWQPAGLSAREPRMQEGAVDLILKVPFHKAKRKNYCTVASLQMVLDYFKVTPLPDQDTLHTHCPYFEACNLNPLAQYGLHVRKIHLREGELALLNELSRGLPVILRILTPRTHSIVLIGRKKTSMGKVKFLYHDPASQKGPSMAAKEVLLDHWGQTGDYAMVFESLREGTGIANMPEKFTANGGQY